jgi:RimJ/RimL family protein N-acetyltransferase
VPTFIDRGAPLRKTLPTPKSAASGYGPKRRFAAVQRYDRCRWNTGRSVDAARAAAPDASGTFGREMSKLKGGTPMDAIQIRPLRVSEWSAFKDFRLAALKSAPGMFATSFEEASARSPEAWQDVIAGPNHQVFGLFDGAQLIGITGVFGGRGKSDDDTAFLVMSFIVPEYRRRGLSSMFYHARLDWIRRHDKFKRTSVAVRASNEASQRACRHFGFECIGRALRTWPDGTTEDELVYELQLKE